MLKFNIDEIEIVTLPKMRVVFFKDFSRKPEMKTEKMLEKWLTRHGLELHKGGVRAFGFDCDEFPTNRPNGKHGYGRYVYIPEDISLNSKEKNIKVFDGGKYARLTIKDPFSGDFSYGWQKLIAWAAENGYKNKNVCKSTGRCNPCAGDCWNSTENEPDLEELYEKDGIQYMNFYLPIE